MRRGYVVAACICLAVGTAEARAQPFTVVGVAYDSLHARPLRNAFVTIGGARTTTTDSLGVFRFDSIAPGSYEFTMLHEALDSIGLSGTRARALVQDASDTVRLSIPAFATFWGRACGPGKAPSDSGFIFGVVRSVPGRQPVPDASVVGRWIELGSDPSTGFVQRRLRLDVATDSTGSYALCGLPTNTATQIRGSTSSLASGFVDLLLTPGSRIQRRDLLVGPDGSLDSVPRGTVVGVVSGEGGRPVGQAMVGADGVDEVRTGSNGRFVLRNVPAGTRQIDVRSIGLMSAQVTVDVVPGDTSYVDARLQKVALLDSMLVRATSTRERLFRDVDERRKSVVGGYFRDSTDMAKHGTVGSVIGGIPSVKITYLRAGEITIALPAPVQRPGQEHCIATLWIDGFIQEHNELKWLRPQDIAMVEIYPRGLSMPGQFAAPGSRTPCGAVVVWTKKVVR